MTATPSDSHVCTVCHRRLSAGDEYLVRLRAGRQTAVHRHVCFPPRRDAARPAPHRAA